MSKARSKIKSVIFKLIRLNSTPSGIALGVALGVFIGTTPLYGFHTAMVLLAAFFVPRTNKVAILLGTNISIPPTMPFLTWGGYEIGRRVLGSVHPPLSWKYFSHITLKNLGDFYYPLFVGSVILGLILAVIFYFITFKAVAHYRVRKSKV